MTNAMISGTGFYVPPRVVTNQDLVEQYGIDTNNEWIVERTGIEERRFAAEGVATSDMGTLAAKDAIAAAGLEPHDIDMIIFATLSPDFAFPGCGVIMQEKLGLCVGENAKFVPALDVRNQCSGFLYGLGTATSMVRAGAYKHVLIVGAEKHSAAIDLSTRGRTVSALFGDGAGAVVVSATDEDRGVRSWTLGADGRYAGALRQKVWDISRTTFMDVDENGVGQIPAEDIWAHMEGKKVFKNAVVRMIEALMRVFATEGVGRDDIDLFVFHQANLRINQYLAGQIGISEDKLVNNIQKYGNTTAATIPILLAEAERSGRLKPGMKVATAAFGSGFTWGGAIIDW